LALFRASQEVAFVKRVWRFGAIEQPQHAFAQCLRRLDQAARHRPTFEQQDAVLAVFARVLNVGPERERARELLLIEIDQQMRQRGLGECACRDGFVSHGAPGSLLAKAFSAYGDARVSVPDACSQLELPHAYAARAKVFACE
jgi:hypothetical protein